MILSKNQAIVDYYAFTHFAKEMCAKTNPSTYKVHTSITEVEF